MEISKNRFIDDIESIVRIDFCISTNKLNQEDSAIADVNGITVAEISNNGEPVVNGVIDKRLGVTEPKITCNTCGETALKCPGHFGHIRLDQAVYHMGYLLYLKDILRCVCIRCNKLLVNKNTDEIARMTKNKHGKQRFIEIRNICKNVSYCQKENSGCGTPAHKITIDKKQGSVFLLATVAKKDESNEEGGGRKKQTPYIITPQLCYDILKGVSDEDCAIMGFDPAKSRPEDMIIINFPVPPVPVRPSIKMEISSSPTVDDDLTQKLINIIRHNENLKDSKGDGSIAKSQGINDDFMFLQFHVATYYANDIVGLPKSLQKNNKVTKSLTERLKGKEGRIRGNLMGKRADMTGRTVITSDPNIALGDVGIPLVIAKNLTIPETVTKNNIKYLSQLVRNGRRVYPGANYVIKNIIDKNGNDVKKYFHLKYFDKEVPLKSGDIVERHIVNNDMVLFNRQPSLHKLSMMGHSTHILNDPSILTFRMNVNVTEPYNADWYRFI